MEERWPHEADGAGEETSGDSMRERAFLLRGWKTEGGGWRFNLETIGPRSRRVGFATPAALYAFLRAAFPSGPPDEE